MAETKQNQKWQEFRRSRMGLVFGMVLTALLSLVILLYGGFIFCLPAILVGVIMYFVPRYFGLKSRKKLVVFGLVLMLFLGVASGITIYSIIKDLQPAPVSSNDGILTQGGVDPFRGSTTTVYNYTVVVQGANASSEVWVSIYDYFASSKVTRMNLTHSYQLTGDARLFFNETTLPGSLYSHAFSFNKSATSVITTSSGWGPLMITDQELLYRELIFNITYVFLNVGLWFFFVLVGAWWMESSKKRVADIQQKKKEGASTPTSDKQGKFVCSECGADVPTDAKECPQCGEKFDEETDQKK